MFDRGYTGHEHLDVFGLINMNGRMYDPTLGRFLSPDVVVQNPGSTQSYNRYSYCFNNPLAYTDPSGWISVGAAQYIDNGRAENARLRAMYSDAADAIYAAANASGAGNMYGIWEEGKLSIYTYSDIGNFREIGSVNEAMGASAVGMTNDDIRDRGIGKDGEKLDGKDDPDADNGGLMSSFGSMVKFMYNKSNPLNKTSDSRTGGVELAAYVLSKWNEKTKKTEYKYFVQPWNTNLYNWSQNYGTTDIPLLQSLYDQGYSVETQVHTHNSDPGGCPSRNDLQMLYNQNLSFMYIIDDGKVLKMNNGDPYGAKGNCATGFREIYSGDINLWNPNYPNKY